ncbi:MAG: type IV secretion system protein [Proteobacteria bacterium]|nr:type IV secretion system protein [Pseudomonadota bacterium]
MKIKNFILKQFRKKSPDSDKSSNPYVGSVGRAEWNDRYMDLRKGRRYWQWAFISSMVVSILLVLVVAYMGSHSRIEPYVVETNQGLAYHVNRLSSLSIKDPVLLNYAANQFIFNAKTIVKDKEAETELLNKLYAYSADATLQYLQAYYEKHDPFILSQEYTRSVNIIESMPLSKNHWQVTWDETRRHRMDNKIMDVTRWMANMTLKYREVDPKFLNENPFGIYITDINWSQSTIPLHWEQSK